MSLSIRMVMRVFPGAEWSTAPRLPALKSYSFLITLPRVNGVTCVYNCTSLHVVHLPADRRPAVSELLLRSRHEPVLVPACPRRGGSHRRDPARPSPGRPVRHDEHRSLGDGGLGRLPLLPGRAGYRPRRLRPGGTVRRADA